MVASPGFFPKCGIGRQRGINVWEGRVYPLFYDPLCFQIKIMQLIYKYEAVTGKFLWLQQFSVVSNILCSMCS